MPRRIKVTILSGFLGAGKTTLLNALLRASPEPIGVIVNDFGAINVDAELVGTPAANDGQIALQDGCICCSIRGDLVGALAEVMRRPAPPAQVIIETSGVSNPAAVARTFLHPSLRECVELSAIIVCVDPSEFTQLIHQHWEIASDQLRVADFVVLTKRDLASAGELIATRELVNNIVQDARILESSREAPPTAVLLDAELAWSPQQRSAPLRAPVHIHELDGGQGQANDHDHDHDHEGHAYETWTYRSEQPFALDALRRSLQRLPRSIFRAKGFVHIAQEPDSRVLVQVVGRRVELAFAGPWTGDPTTELVFLGSEGSLDPEQLRTCLDPCWAPETRPGVDAHDPFMQEMVGLFERALDGTPRS